MKEFKNVNDAFQTLVRYIQTGWIETITTPSRVGNVKKVPYPVLIKYEKPFQRVLFNTQRDCNPFFHLYESLWMLAGKNDVESLKFYNSKIGVIASDNGETFNGAYGYRWRTGPGWDDSYMGNPFLVNQLDILIEHLKQNPNSRRAVLQMWNVGDDLLKIDSSKDVCCNLSVLFSLRKRTYHTISDTVNKYGNGVNIRHELVYLDMTVTNRSNDMIWGMLGANVVHFSFLQEYVANCLGVQVGNYYHFTNNLHVYETNWEPEKWQKFYSNTTKEIQYGKLQLVKLVRNKEVFDTELERFMVSPLQDWEEPFLESVAKPMCFAFALHKERKYEQALELCGQIAAEDWRIACTNWIRKRWNSYARK